MLFLEHTFLRDHWPEDPDGGLQQEQGILLRQLEPEKWTQVPAELQILIYLKKKTEKCKEISDNCNIKKKKIVKFHKHLAFYTFEQSSLFFSTSENSSSGNFLQSFLSWIRIRIEKNCWIRICKKWMGIYSPILWNKNCHWLCPLISAATVGSILTCCCRWRAGDALQLRFSRKLVTVRSAENTCGLIDWLGQPIDK